ncbi:MAG TPA: protein phosphatase 2C domain-containing protein [Terriglobia bacterium]|nr:protein phosphatase 2C domain-containing protein [Terriglobia bacterium]
MEEQSSTPQRDSVGIPELENGPWELHVVARSDPGRKRQNNEDSYLVLDLFRGQAHPEGTRVLFDLDPVTLLLAVADGMGGHQSGEVASRVCMETLSGVLLTGLPRAPIAPFDGRLALMKGVEEANRVVCGLARQDSQYQGMGTTLTAALVTGTSVFVGQVGDSRAYLLRGGAITQLTKDQTVGNSLLELQPDAAISENVASMLVQAIGVEPQVDVVVTEVQFQFGDMLLLCSDGLSKVVSAVEMAQIAGQPGSLKAKAEGLIARANEGGGPDNITVVLSRIQRKGGD